MTATERLTLLQNAEREILETGQDVTVEGRRFRRADLDVLGRLIARVEVQVKRDLAGNRRGRVGIRL